MTTRNCDCPHAFPFCACHLGYTGASLEYHARLASAIIGWPSTAYDEDALVEHNERVANAKANVEAARKAIKPRVPLGVDQATIPPPACIPCRDRAASHAT